MYDRGESELTQRVLETTRISNRRVRVNYVIETLGKSLDTKTLLGEDVHESSGDYVHDIVHHAYCV